MYACMIFLLLTQETKMIGVMGAMEVEVELIGDVMKIERIDTIGMKTYKIGSVFDVPCVLAEAGVGKVASTQTAQTFIMGYGVELIIFTGVAGGINPVLEVGDIVISKEVVHHDFGQILPDSFIPFDTIGFPADSHLIRLALNAGEKVELVPVIDEMKIEGRMPEVILGRIATGDQFISSEAKRLWIARVFNADCVEMEGAAVAQVCSAYDVPFLIIRSLSDLANEDADIDFQTFVVHAAENSSRLVKEIIRQLARPEDR